MGRSLTDEVRSAMVAAAGRSTPEVDRKFHKHDEYRSLAQKKFDQGFDAVILGHSHLPLLENIEGRYLINSGDWISKFSYVVLADGKFELKYWKE